MSEKLPSLIQRCLPIVSNLPNPQDSILSRPMIHLPLTLMLATSGLLGFLGGEEGFRSHIQILQQAYKNQPSAALSYRIAVGHASRGAVALTEAWLIRAKRLGTDETRIDACLGDAHLAADDYEEAIRWYFSALEKTPDHYPILYRLWRARLLAPMLVDHLDLKRLDSVLESHGFPVVKFSEETDFRGAALEVRKARDALRLNRLDQAEGYLRLAIEKHWLAPESYRLLSEIWNLRGQPRKRHGAQTIYLEFAMEPDQLYRRVLRTWMDYERRGKQNP